MKTTKKKLIKLTKPKIKILLILLIIFFLTACAKKIYITRPVKIKIPAKPRYEKLENPFTSTKKGLLISYPKARILLRNRVKEQTYILTILKIIRKHNELAERKD